MASEFTALLAAISFALFAVLGWLGLRYSTPLTATIVSLAARTATLGAALVLSGGVPHYARAALAVFVFLGVLQSATSLLTFVGLQKVGTARSQPLRNSYPLWGAALAMIFMDERAALAVIGGTLLVVAGIVLISWKPETAPVNHRWWHVLYSLGAGFLAVMTRPTIGRRSTGFRAERDADVHGKEFAQARRMQRIVSGMRVCRVSRLTMPTATRRRRRSRWRRRGDDRAS